MTEPEGAGETPTARIRSPATSSILGRRNSRAASVRAEGHHLGVGAAPIADQPGRRGRVQAAPYRARPTVRRSSVSSGAYSSTTATAVDVHEPFGLRWHDRQQRRPCRRVEGDHHNHGQGVQRSEDGRHQHHRGDRDRDQRADGGRDAPPARYHLRQGEEDRKGRDDARRRGTPRSPGRPFRLRRRAAEDSPLATSTVNARRTRSPS